MTKKQIYWISMDPSDFKRDNDWVYNFSAEQRGVYWQLYVEIADAGGGIDYLPEELAVRCKSSTEIIDYIIDKKFYLVKHKGRNSKNKPLEIRHKSIDLKIKEAKKRVSDAEKAINARWQKDTAVLRGEQRGNYQKNIKEKNIKDLKNIYTKKLSPDFEKVLKAWSARKGIPPDSVSDREIEQLQELLAQMSSEKFCEIMASDVFALTPKSLVVEWSKHRNSEKPTLTEQYFAYQRQKKLEGG